LSPVPDEAPAESSPALSEAPLEALSEALPEAPPEALPEAPDFSHAGKRQHDNNNARASEIIFLNFMANPIHQKADSLSLQPLKHQRSAHRRQSIKASIGAAGT